MTALDPAGRPPCAPGSPRSPRRRPSSSRSLIHTLRTPDALVMAIALPSILMLLFTFVFGGAIEEDGSYVNYVVPGIILLCAGFGSSSVAVDVANDMQTGIIDRFRTMPMRASAVITGHVVASVLRNLVTTGDRDRRRDRGRIPPERDVRSTGSRCSA